MLRSVVDPGFMADEANLLRKVWLLRIGGRFVQRVDPEKGLIVLTQGDKPEGIYRYYTFEEAQADATRIFRWAEREDHEWVHNQVIKVVEVAYTEVDRLEPSVTPRPPPVPRKPGERLWTEDAQGVLDVWTAFCEAQTGHPNCYEAFDQHTREPVLYLWEPFYERRTDGGIYGVIRRVVQKRSGTFWGNFSHHFNIGGDGELRLVPRTLKAACKRASEVKKK